MRAVFDTVLGMSLAGSWVIGFVLAARLLLRRLPARFRYLLWGLVLLRLLCPVSLESPASLLPERDPIVVNSISVPRAEPSKAPAVQHTPPATVDAEAYPAAPAASPAKDAQPSGTAAAPARQPFPGALLLRAVLRTLRAVWLPGAALLLCASGVSLLQLRRRLVGAVPLRDNIWLADHIDTAFVLGVVRPRIYLPSSLPEGEQEYILLHEQTHLRRLDPLWKLLGLAALAVHWFNPLVWLAVRCAGRDMELSCDEAVLARLGPGIRQQYAASLLRLSSARQPGVAFGEGSTKTRILNVLHYKSPRLLVSLAGATVVILLACGLLTDPVKDVKLSGLAGSYAVMEYVPAPPSAADGLPKYSQYLLSDGAGTFDGFRVTQAGLFWIQDGKPAFRGELKEFELREKEFTALFGSESGLSAEDAAGLYQQNRKLWGAGIANHFQLLLLQKDGTLYLLDGLKDNFVSEEESGPMVMGGYRILRDAEVPGAGLPGALQPGTYAVTEVTSVWLPSSTFIGADALPARSQYLLSNGAGEVGGYTVNRAGLFRLQEGSPQSPFFWGMPEEYPASEDEFAALFGFMTSMDEDAARKLYRGNRGMWRTETASDFRLLLQQEDGSLYLFLGRLNEKVSAEETAPQVTWGFRLEPDGNIPAPVEPGTYAVTEIWYEALEYNFAYTLETVPSYIVHDSGNVSVSGNIVGTGSFPAPGQASLSTENFDSGFSFPGEVQHMAPGEIREQAEWVWKTSRDGESLCFIQLKKQPDGTQPLLLANGYVGGDGVKNNIRWLFRLEKQPEDGLAIPSDDYRVLSCIYNAPYNSSEPDLAHMPGFSVYAWTDGKPAELCREIIGEDASEILGELYPLRLTVGNFDGLFPSRAGWSGWLGLGMETLREECEGAWLLSGEDSFYILLSEMGGLVYLAEGSSQDGVPEQVSHVYLLGPKGQEREQLSKDMRGKYDQLRRYTRADYDAMTVGEFNRWLAPDRDAEVQMMNDYTAVMETLPSTDPSADFFEVTLAASFNEMYAKALGDDCNYIFSVLDNRRPYEPLSWEEVQMLAISPVYRFHFSSTVIITYELDEGVTVGERDNVLRNLRHGLQERVEQATEGQLTREPEVLLHSWAKEILSETPHDGMLVTFFFDSTKAIVDDGDDTGAGFAEYVE